LSRQWGPHTINLQKDIAHFTSDLTIADDIDRLKGAVPSLAKQIKEVEVWCEADFLNKHELEIIDTPGLGAVFPEHKEAAYNLLSEVDAIMYLFPIDPGIGVEDILFLRDACKQVKHLFLVMTKCDHVRSLEETQDRASFNQWTIQISAGITEEKMTPVYPISAQMKLERLDPAGFPEVIEALEASLVSYLADLIRFTLTQARFIQRSLNTFRASSMNDSNT
jgi:hypothetical protein